MFDTFRAIASDHDAVVTFTLVAMAAVSAILVLIGFPATLSSRWRKLGDKLIFWAIFVWLLQTFGQWCAGF